MPETIEKMHIYGKREKKCIYMVNERKNAYMPETREKMRIYGKREKKCVYSYIYI